MTTEEIIQHAAKDQFPQEMMNCAERCLFYTLREIYRDFRSRTIGIEEGEKRKKAALHQFKNDAEDLSRGKALMLEHGIFWQRIETAGSRYRNNPTIETADAFIEAVYGVGRKPHPII